MTHYRYFCNNCGAPHRHRNENKYPELCKPCATRQALRDRYTAKNNDKGITRLFQTIRVDLAKVSGRHETHVI